MVTLHHPETRQSLNRFSVEELQDLHLQLFDEESHDSIKRRVALKIWKHLEKTYKDYQGLHWPCLVCEEDSDHKCCPVCWTRAEGVDEVKKVFGLRTVNGRVRPQSWCRRCRSSKREQ